MAQESNPVVDWIKAGLIPVIAVAGGMYVSIQVLQVKFDAQNTQAAERYRIMLTIQSGVSEVRKEIQTIVTGAAVVESRVATLERFVPRTLKELKAEQARLQNELNLLAFRLDRREDNEQGNGS